jgi:phosphate-selective porin OprO/OprP
MSLTTRAVVAAAVASVSFSSVSRGDAPPAEASVASELASLKARIAELEKKESEAWLTQERTAQIRGIVEDVLADAKTRKQFSDNPDFGYKNGFFIQTADQNFKLVVGGFAQVRYEFAQSNATNNRTFPSRNIGDDDSTTPDDPGNSNGFTIRRARINFSGHAFHPNITYKFEGDFYGSNDGGFTVTDAWIGYKWTDLFRVRAGSYKAPFAKTELASDTGLVFMERPEVLAPFDPVRSIGVSLFGDIVKDQWGYEVMINNGSSANTLRRPDTVGLSANLDNRMGFYARTQFAGNGKISDFADEPDLRKDNNDFIWLVGGAAGYESQNATNNAFPSPQTSLPLNGLSSDDSAGFVRSTALNGDIFRATLDWSAKWRGASFITSAYFQQVNQNEGNTSSSSASSVSFGPYGSDKTSFFQHGYYAQAGYFVIPEKLELAARAGVLLTEGGPNIGEFYSLGANYYLYGNNVKLQSDVTYTPEAPYTDSAAALLQNTHDVIFRMQLQLKF